ncbi:hypothetical protein [Actinokineospora sp. NBRC 105648]|uniref:hypothetical protein n=1 Tax=Actinokineospora sp. NBRC 105648 TaxID=3032206 RepID=UPI0024A55FFD|nr:hypothetical protein [Actinokineospora sp. NBRC 105648]GLZ40288.1 hypothetical protein Acsp05_39120 [Actinokineospora sp. NBRC 105648]
MVEMARSEHEVAVRRHMRGLTELVWPQGWPEVLDGRAIDHNAQILVSMCTLAREVATNLRARLTDKSGEDELAVLADCESAITQAMTKAMQFSAGRQGA